MRAFLFPLFFLGCTPSPLSVYHRPVLRSQQAPLLVATPGPLEGAEETLHIVWRLPAHYQPSGTVTLSILTGDLQRSSMCWSTSQHCSRRVVAWPKQELEKRRGLMAYKVVWRGDGKTLSWVHPLWYDRDSTG